MFLRLVSLASLLACLCCVPVQAQSRKAPPGVFKELDDEILGDALIIRGKQLFIDDHVIAELKGVRKQLNQPVKYKKNPVLKRDKPWEKSGPGYSTIIYDAEEKLFKVWYETWDQDDESKTFLHDRFLVLFKAWLPRATPSTNHVLRAARSAKSVANVTASTKRA